MVKIIKGRGEGKTTELIKMSHDTNTYILVANANRVREIADMAREMELSIPFPVTVDEYFSSHGFQGSFIRNILIDDAEDVLKTVFNRLIIDAITLTTESE